MGQCYRDLKVWQQSVDLVEHIYKATMQFPKTELYGLTSQMRRASVSVPSNIAEGQGRRSPKEFCQFLRHSRGSLMELETQVLVSVKLGFLSEDEGELVLSKSASIGRMLNGLIESQSKAT